MPNNKELLAYRARLLARLQAASAEFCAACRAISDPFAPLEPGGWNTHQIAAHVRDVNEQVYGLRIRRTATETRPVFENFSADDWKKTAYRPAEKLEDILTSLETSSQTLTAWLETLPPQAWSRLSRHEALGECTLQGWVERGLAHIQEHLATLTIADLKIF